MIFCHVSLIQLSHTLGDIALSFHLIKSVLTKTLEVSPNGRIVSMQRACSLRFLIILFARRGFALRSADLNNVRNVSKKRHTERYLLDLQLGLAWLSSPAQINANLRRILKKSLPK